MNVSLSKTLTEMLAYPRMLMRTNLPLEDCANSENFSGDDPRCRRCGARYECRWLQANDEIAALCDRSQGELLTALSVAITYVRALLEREGHRRSKCGCEACRWLRRARRLQADRVP